MSTPAAPLPSAQHDPYPPAWQRPAGWHVDQIRKDLIFEEHLRYLATHSRLEEHRGQPMRVPMWMMRNGRSHANTK